MPFRMWSSKFRHVYGDAHRKEKCYENIKITRNAHDSNFCAVNPKYLAVVTECVGGGTFIVLPLSRTGRVDINAPQVCGHSSNVLDIKWNPFRDDMIASGSEDTTVKVWQIPEGGLRSNLKEWHVDLHGHDRRVWYIEWHPTADNILLSAGLDYKCIIWNVEQAEPVNVITCHNDIIQSISWNLEGSLFCTTCKDRTMRVVEPRSGQCVVEVTNCFKGNRPSKGLFLGDENKVFCTGFNNSGEREIALWDIKNTKSALVRKTVDNSNGILIPFYDSDTHIVFLAGKGDGNIHYYEMVENSPYCHYLNTFGSSSPQRGLGLMPKRGCDANRCEIMRFYKLHAAKNFVEPISMIVPRKSNTFHADIFPPTISAIPSLTADEWLSGQNRGPIRISMKDHQVINDPKYVISKACQSQDVGLNQNPTITTYKTVSSSSNRWGSNAEPSKSERKMPASLENIKRLSTCDDIVMLTPGDMKTINKETSSPVVHDPQKDKAFVYSTIAGFESIGATHTNNVTSPSKRRNERLSWSANMDNPPDLIATEITTSTEQIHVKKTWSPVKSPSSPVWEDGTNMPNTDPELRKAYFQQANEIKALKEQLLLKNKRIQQLEDEMNFLHKGLLPKKDNNI